MSTCLLCKSEKEISECMTLKCNHSFCWVCLNKYLVDNLQPKIKCPQKVCVEMIKDSQIRKVLQDEDITTYENMCLSGIKKTHKCLLKECLTSIAYTDSNTQYACPSCNLYNCIQCKAAHMFSSCAEYKRMSTAKRNNICQTEIERAKQILTQRKKESLREMLVSLEDLDLMANTKVFECSICTLAICKGEGVKLRNCSHNICKSCLCNHISSINSIPVKCPEIDCKSVVTDQEIGSILTDEDLLQYVAKYNLFSISNISNRLHCQSPNCNFFYVCSIKPEKFTCDKCKQVTCVKCVAVHLNETCEQFQKKLLSDPTYQKIEEQIKAGKLMKCPGCFTLIEKISGCNWIQCSTCSLELCWIRQMPRWGPKGRNDTSGGCRCMVNGVPCHPSCAGCIPDNAGGNHHLLMRRLLRDILILRGISVPNNSENLSNSDLEMLRRSLQIDRQSQQNERCCML